MNKRRFFLKQSAAIALGAKSYALTPKQENKKYAMLIDLRKCVACHSCTVSCKIENKTPANKFRTNVAEFEIGLYPNVRKAFLPSLCNHCDNAPCISVCPTGATFKRKDGIVVVDASVCWGCGYCVNACPYDKRFINPITKVADKCNFCLHRLNANLLSACVQNCVGGARIIGDLNDSSSLISKLLATHQSSVLKQSSRTKPNVYYIGLNGQLSDNIFSLDDVDGILKSKNQTSIWQSKGE